jgi:hypothetical protein
MTYIPLHRHRQLGSLDHHHHRPQLQDIQQNMNNQFEQKISTQNRYKLHIEIL